MLLLTRVKERRRKICPITRSLLMLRHAVCVSLFRGSWRLTRLTRAIETELRESRRVTRTRHSSFIATLDLIIFKLYIYVYTSNVFSPCVCSSSFLSISRTLSFSRYSFFCFPLLLLLFDLDVTVSREIGTSFWSTTRSARGTDVHTTTYTAVQVYICTEYSCRGTSYVSYPGPLVERHETPRCPSPYLHPWLHTSI